MKVKVNKVTIQLVQDDILSLAVDGIVNSTDPNLHLNPPLLLKDCPVRLPDDGMTST